MKRIIFSMLLGLAVLCPIQSVHSMSSTSGEGEELTTEQLKRKIFDLQKHLGIKKKTLPGGRVVTVRRRVTKYDSPHKQELSKQLQEAKKKLKELEDSLGLGSYV